MSGEVTLRPGTTALVYPPQILPRAQPRLVAVGFFSAASPTPSPLDFKRTLQICPSAMSPGKERSYERVPTSEDDAERQPQSRIISSRKRRPWLIDLCGASILATLIFIAGYTLASRTAATPGSSTLSGRCENPIIRREWRMLSTQEKEHYIDSVQCLQRIPSRFGQNQSAFDDFPWIHSKIRGEIHETAAFLAWHRYYIHLMEKTLQDMCDFQGHLPYWNWVLDWEDFTKAPVWHDTLGFGGDGSGGEEKFNGTCVSKGPFANYQVKQFGDLEETHCLSRGFLRGQDLWDISSSKIMPSVVDEVLDASNYTDFNHRLEMGPHHAIPYGIRGDFLKFSAPAGKSKPCLNKVSAGQRSRELGIDPVFYLHHGQLDRLWWLWQQRNPVQRTFDYGGGVRGGPNANTGGLEDVLDFHGLAANVRVREVMDTQSRDGLFCYAY